MDPSSNLLFLHRAWDRSPCKMTYPGSLFLWLTSLLHCRVIDVNNDDEPCWYSGEESVVKYTVETNAGLYLSQWDYIMLYKVRGPSRKDTKRKWFWYIFVYRKTSHLWKTTLLIAGLRTADELDFKKCVLCLILHSGHKVTPFLLLIAKLVLNKLALLMNFEGNYVLVYISASKSILGVSNSFPVK